MSYLTMILILQLNEDKKKNDIKEFLHIKEYPRLDNVLYLGNNIFSIHL